LQVLIFYNSGYSGDHQKFRLPIVIFERARSVNFAERFANLRTINQACG